MTPAIVHHFSSGVYAKETLIPAGMALVQHKHAFDHLSILASGTVDVTVEGKTTRFTGADCLTIEAGKHHGVKAITDTVWYCIHATDCTDESKVDEVLIVPSDQQEMQSMADSL